MPELRKDPLTDRWVIIATERTKNPTDLLPSDFLHNGHDSLAIDPLAAGNERMTPPEILAVRPKGGPANTAGWKVRVIPNTYPVLRVEGELRPEGFGLYDKMTGIGAHEIIVETPDTDQGLETLPLEDIAEVFRTFKVRMQDLEKDQRFRYFLIFKNVGRVAGSPLRHAHSQLIATPVIPRVVETKLATSRKYYEAKERQASPSSSNSGELRTPG